MLSSWNWTARSTYTAKDNFQLVNEVGRSGLHWWASLGSSKEEKELLRLSQDAALVEKLINFSLSPAEWDEYVKRKPEMKDISSLSLGLIEPFERFNECAVARN